MPAERKPAPAGRYREMDQRIQEIERLAQELRELGKGLPVVESNARGILSFTHLLRFGISDLVAVIEQ